MADFDLDDAVLQAVLRDPDGPVGREIAKRVAQVERRAKRLAPVDTGRLKTSIQSEMRVEAEGPVGYIGTRVHYARYVEEGTRYARAQPFLRPALDAVRKYVQRAEDRDARLQVGRDMANRDIDRITGDGGDGS